MLSSVDLSLLSKQPQSNRGRCLRLRNVKTRIPVKMLDLWHRVRKHVFSWNLHANVNPLQNIIRLFLRFSSAAEEDISV